MKTAANEAVNSYYGLATPLPVNGVEARLKQACSDFEAIFLNYMFKTMRKTLSGTDIVGKGLAGDIYETMYYQQLSVDMAGQGKALGIGEALYQELYSKMTGQQSGPARFKDHYG